MKWWERPTIPMAECVDRTVYELQSRNLVVGAWNAATKGFVGIREKFDSQHLFVEYHHDTGSPLGTARAFVALATLPDEIEVVEYFRDELCRCHGRATIWKPDDPARGPEGTPGARYHADDESPLEFANYPVLTANKALFDFLAPYQVEVLRRYEDES